MSAWNPHDHPIDYYLLNGRPSPGISDVAGAGTPRKWDERMGYGLSGATLVFTGNGLAKFTCKSYLWLPEHWDAFAAFKPLVARPPNGVRPRALSIWHPWLEFLDIKSAVVEDLHQPELVDETGLWSVEIEFHQWRRVQLTLSKPEGSDTKETDPVQQYIGALDGTNAQMRDMLARGDVGSPLPPLPPFPDIP